MACRGVARAFEVDLQREEVVGLDAGGRGAQMEKGAEQQRASGEQSRGETDLCDEEVSAGAAGGDRCAGGARARERCGCALTEDVESGEKADD